MLGVSESKRARIFGAKRDQRGFHLNGILRVEKDFGMGGDGYLDFNHDGMVKYIKSR